MAVRSDGPLNDVEVVEASVVDGRLNAPITGEAPVEPLAYWARAGAPPLKWPRGWAPSARGLSTYFPLGWAKVGDQAPKVGIDSGFAVNGRVPCELWADFVRLLERVEFDERQGQSATLMVTSGTFSGGGKAAVIRCRKCGTDSAALDDAKVCALGCES